MGAVVSAFLAVASGVLAFKQPVQQLRRALIFLCVICTLNAVFLGLRESGLLRSRLLLWIVAPGVIIACICFHAYNKRRK